MSASLKFQDCTTTQRDYFLDCLAGADAARQEAVVTTATAEKHALAWSRWTEFLQLIGTGDDVFLDKVSPRDRTVILGAFAHAVRQASFSGPKFSRLAASTVRDTVSHVCSSFRHNQRRDPGKDGIGQPSFLLQRQFRGHSQSDPAERPEKAITCRLLREIASVRETEEDHAVGQLAVGAFFFAMRSLANTPESAVSAGPSCSASATSSSTAADGACVTTTGPSSQQTLSPSPLSSRRTTSVTSRLRNTAPTTPPSAQFELGLPL